MAKKLLTLADELANQGLQAASPEDPSAQLPSQNLIHTAAVGTSPLDVVATELIGKAFQAQYADFVEVGQVDFPFTTVTAVTAWAGGSTRGFGIDFGFGNPSDGVNSLGEKVTTVDLYHYFSISHKYSAGTAFDVLAYNGTNVLLGEEPFIASGTTPLGYSTYLLVHNTTLNPATTNETFPFTVDTGSETPALPPTDPAVPAPPCYLAGTRIATARGDVAVEDLKIGDLVRTVNGAPGLKPVIWIGQRALNAANHPEPEQVLPVRIRAGAFGEGLPARDLLVSPDHAIFVDGALIPARLLINNGSIVQDASVRAIRYFHVELDSHSVVLAEGLAAESYLPGANRATFANGGEAVELHPSFGTDQSAYASSACAPLVVDAAAVLPVWSRLAARGAALGLAPSLPAVTAEPEFRIVVGKRVLTGAVCGDRVVFTLPRATKSVRLVSRGARPADTRPWLDDRRRLGVMVAGLAVQTGRGRKEIAVEAAALTEGWWAVETSEVGAVRWTNGDAAVNLPRGAKTLEVRLIGEMSYPADVALAA